MAIRILYVLTIDREATMHLFSREYLREALNQAVASPDATDEHRHLVRKLLLHPRALRVAHELIQHAMEQTVPVESVAAMFATAPGGFATFLQWILDHWPQVLDAILTALKLFHLTP